MSLPLPSPEPVGAYPAHLFPVSGHRCHCQHACSVGGSCYWPITGEDLLCDSCRKAPLHCHALGAYTGECQLPAEV